MEKKIEIETDDGHVIHGALNGELAGTLVVLVHGFGRDMNQHIFYNASRLFPDKGFATYRFNLYGWEDDARHLRECSLTDHVNDLEAVIRHFHEDVDSIAVVGHSIAGPVIALADMGGVDAIVLWDPTDTPSEYFGEDEYIDELDAYKTPPGGIEILYGPEMHEELMQIDSTPELFNDTDTPLKAILAEKAEMVAPWRDELDCEGADREVTVMEDAGHMFDEEGMEKKLFEETLSWLKERME